MIPSMDFFGAGGLRSSTARWFVAVGYLGLLGFVGHATGSPRMQGVTSLLALVSVGYGIEWAYRSRLGLPMWTAHHDAESNEPRAMA